MKTAVYFLLILLGLRAEALTVIKYDGLNRDWLACSVEFVFKDGQVVAVKAKSGSVDQPVSVSLSADSLVGTQKYGEIVSGSMRLHGITTRPQGRQEVHVWLQEPRDEVMVSYTKTSRQWWNARLIIDTKQIRCGHLQRTVTGFENCDHISDLGLYNDCRAGRLRPETPPST